jgi:hypothetical protein
MKRLIRLLLPGVAFLTLTAAASAQFGPPEGPYRPDRVDRLIDRVHDDLNHGYSVWHLSDGERDRLNHAEKELREFARKWRTGKFDKGQLDDSIASVQHVLDKNHLSGAERDALWEDVTALRRMREAYDRHEIGTW